MRRIAAPWLALVCTACGASSLERPGEVLLDPVAIILSEEVVDFTAIGATRRLSAVAVAADGHPIFGAPIAWSSTDPTVASVDSHGLVTALSQGRADIVASYGGVASRALVRVSPVPRDLAKLAILPSAPLLTYLGQTLELRAVALDRNDNVLGEVLATWEVEDAQVATVDRMGILVAMAPGATRVRATVVDRSLSTETTITVRPLPSTLIFLSLPVDVEAGQPRSVRIEARDAGGRLVGTPDLTVELWAEYADGFSIHIGQRVLDLGIATFDEVVFQRSGEVRLVARHGSVEAKSASFLVVPGPASGLRFLDPPERVEARTPFELRVAITDEYGNPVPSTKAVIHLSLREANPSGLELGGETSREVIDGVATFSDLVLDAAGDVVVEAASFPWEAAEIPLRARYVFSRLSAGSDHTCGVLSSGETLCFGANDGGQLGLPSDDAQAAPVPVLGLPLLRELEAAFRYSCGISFEDEVICWGEVPGIVPPPAGPVVLALPAAAPRSLGLGANHLCVAFDDGQVHCLGDNTFGQLGDGGTVARPVLAPVSTGASFVSVASGNGFSCALDDDGFPWCWGRNDLGQLGGASEEPISPSPVRLGGIRLASLALGDAHACGISREGEVICWGDGRLGQVADSEFPSNSEPRTVELGGRAVMLAAGALHVCALREDAHVFCWGEGAEGRLGTPDADDAPSAVPVRVEFPFAGARFVHLTAGEAHACAIEATGPAFCWGRGGSGQLGDGATASRAAPAPVAGTAP